MSYPTLEDAIGKTPLVRLQRVPGADCDARGNVILAKLEGNNPAGSVKDRPAINMIRRAEERGQIKPGDTLIEATSGNTGIALAMAAAIRGYRMVLIMPEDLSIERAQTMKAFGAELILTPKSGGMEYARDLADQMVREGKGVVLDQLSRAARLHRLQYGIDPATKNRATIGGGIGTLIRPNTKAVFCEAPGSLTFEMQDIPAIAKVAHQRVLGAGKTNVGVRHRYEVAQAFNACT